MWNQSIKPGQDRPWRAPAALIISITVLMRKNKIIILTQYYTGFSVGILLLLLIFNS